MVGFSKFAVLAFVSALLTLQAHASGTQPSAERAERETKDRPQATRSAQKKQAHVPDDLRPMKIERAQSRGPASEIDPFESAGN